MQDASQQKVSRVRHWLDRVRVITNPAEPLGQRALGELPAVTRLSLANVQWALTHAFEHDATDEDLQALIANTVEAPSAHVLLSANVFAGAVRAIAIALASSNQVFVRPSRREPLMADLLHCAAPDAFSLVAELHPLPGDHVWAYGSDRTMAHLEAELPKGVCLHAYPSGCGVVVVDTPSALTLDDFDALALDVAAFDQQGCLSPRLVSLNADSEQAARAFAAQMTWALDRVAERLPLGQADARTLAAAVRHREIWRCLGEVYESKGGAVTLDLAAQSLGDLPSNRTLHVRVTRDLDADLLGWSDAITAVSSRRDPAMRARCARLLPKARWSPFGWMQRPRLDGPVDRRTDPRGIRL